jgi:hypothetical protein
MGAAVLSAARAAFTRSFELMAAISAVLALATGVLAAVLLRRLPPAASAESSPPE